MAVTMKHEKSKHNFNIVLLGDKNVGKSELLKSYLEHYFTNFDSYSINTFNNCFVKNTKLDSTSYTLRIWEWASNAEEAQAWNNGKDASVTLDDAVLRGADCFLLCYAINNANSFRNIELTWIPEIRKQNTKGPIILVGTKLDLKYCYGSTRVSDLAVQKMKFRTNAFSVLECSSGTLEGVPQVFKDAIEAASKHKGVQCIIM